MRVQELNLGVGCLKVPARCVTYLKRLHMLSHGQQGGGGWVGAW